MLVWQIEKHTAQKRPRTQITLEKTKNKRNTLGVQGTTKGAKLNSTCRIIVTITE